MSLTLVAGASPMAFGAPTTPPSKVNTQSQCGGDCPSSPPPRHHVDVRNLTAKEKSQAAFVTRMFRYSVTRTKSKQAVMDYAKADKFDQGHVTSRRRVAVGILLAGGKITHISSAELHRVKVYMPKDPWKLSREHLGRKHCTGSNGLVIYHGAPLIDADCT